ncbi:hypothetical protein CRUP_021735 [Coryphaenoides rupestris]|nr:hypothetical protein CRUP_021735 [Coryphaenoides rupestris]
MKRCWPAGLRQASIMPRGYISPPKSPFTDSSRTYGRYCYACDSRFPSRALLEVHPCPALTHICSCGTEFPLYSDVDAHSKTHQPGHSVVDHKAVRRRRLVREQEAKVQSAPVQGPSAGLDFGTRPTPVSSLEFAEKRTAAMTSIPKSLPFRGSLTITL